MCVGHSSNFDVTKNCRSGDAEVKIVNPIIDMIIENTSY